MLETDDGLSLSPSFLDQRQKSQSQSQNLIRSLKVSVSKIDTGYTESQSQYAKTCTSQFAPLVLCFIYPLPCSCVLFVSLPFVTVPLQNFGEIRIYLLIMHCKYGHCVKYHLDE